MRRGRFNPTANCQRFRHRSNEGMAQMPTSHLQGPVSDEDIRRSAGGMIHAYPAAPAAECERQIAKMVRQDDTKGEHVWRRILQAVQSVKRRARRTADSILHRRRDRPHSQRIPRAEGIWPPPKGAASYWRGAAFSNLAAIALHEQRIWELPIL
jgi:hypothetical protein